MSDQTRAAPGPARPHRIIEPLDVAGAGIPPAAEHTVQASRTGDRPTSQPGLDADRIDLYRHHQCLRALQRGTSQARQDFSEVPRTHQFLVTLTVHTNKINSTTAAQATSARSMTSTYPVIVIPRDGQHQAATEGENPSEGLMLHPVIDGRFDEEVVIQGRRIRFATVDLTAAGSKIADDFLAAVSPSTATNAAPRTSTVRVTTPDSSVQELL